MFQEESQEAVPEEEEYEMYDNHHVDIKPIPYQDSDNEEEIPISQQDVEQHMEGLMFIIIFPCYTFKIKFPIRQRRSGQRVLGG